MDRSQVYKIGIYQLQQVLQVEGYEGMTVFGELKKGGGRGGESSHDPCQGIVPTTTWRDYHSKSWSG
jgi:hypothetical protein